NVITADKVFSMAQFFNILQMGMAIQYPLAISMGAETKVSIRRLQSFLLLEEKETSKIEGTEEGEIQITNVSASWTPTSHTLKNITLHIPTGSLCAIVGPVGSGKSSLLQLLLGELPCKSGNSTSEEKYHIPPKNHGSSRRLFVAISSSVKLTIDHGTEVVKERGVSLSGGQRARINLARAIYRKANIYIMDDPLSAVDTHVGRHLFDECIYKHLEKNKILVTHQLQYLRRLT
ncbi:Multidrug resistance-associated protein 4, partial [Gonioctena quinquepunctata]